MTDAVDKVGDDQRAGNNRIQVPSFSNQCCAPDSYLETMLLTRPSKNVYRQHRPKADTRSVKHPTPVRGGCTLYWRGALWTTTLPLRADVPDYPVYRRSAKLIALGRIDRHVEGGGWRRCDQCNTGWTTKIIKEGNTYKKTAYDKGKPLDGPPTNSSDAEKVGIERFAPESLNAIEETTEPPISELEPFNGRFVVGVLGGDPLIKGARRTVLLPSRSLNLSQQKQSEYDDKHDTD